MSSGRCKFYRERESGSITGGGAEEQDGGIEGPGDISRAEEAWSCETVVMAHFRICIHCSLPAYDQSDLEYGLHICMHLKHRDEPSKTGDHPHYVYSRFHLFSSEPQRLGRPASGVP